MQDLDRALAQISEIRSQLARDGEFRGYGPATLTATAATALLAAVIQANWLENPVQDIGAYLTLWISAAILAVVLVGIEMTVHTRRAHAGLALEMAQTAIEQFMPAAMAGALLTAVIVRFAPEAQWMLPGLWQIVFSLGVFASCRFLPRAMFAVGLWYLGAGLLCLAFASGDLALSPWAMGIPYGIGQLLVAAVVLHNHRGHDEAD